MIEKGFSSPLEVVLPHTTIPSWPCLFSGLDIENLGYYSFINPYIGIFNSNIWKEKSIFSLPDIKSFILNVPGTFPAWKINGEMITGILSPSISCYPKELETIYENNWIIEGRDFKDIINAFNMKQRLFLRKLKENYDLMVYVIRVPDAISHRILGDEKRILKYISLGYQKIDLFLGEIFQENNFDNIIIVSDHGLKYYRNVFHFPRWLEKKKLLFLNDITGNKILSIFLKLYDFLRPFIKIQTSKRIYKKIPISQRREKQKKYERKLVFFNKDNPKTFIQKLTSNVGALFLFGEDKKKQLSIKRALEKAKIVEKILEFDKKGFPDFLIILKDTYIFTKESSLFLKRKTEIFSHSNRGFFIAFGKDIRHGKMEVVNYQNVAPTILRMFNREKFEYMKGHSLSIFKDS